MKKWFLALLVAFSCVAAEDTVNVITVKTNSGETILAAKAASAEINGIKTFTFTKFDGKRIHILADDIKSRSEDLVPVSTLPEPIRKILAREAIAKANAEEAKNDTASSSTPAATEPPAQPQPQQPQQPDRQAQMREKAIERADHETQVKKAFARSEQLRLQGLEIAKGYDKAFNALNDANNHISQLTPALAQAKAAYDGARIELQGLSANGGIGTTAAVNLRLQMQNAAQQKGNLEADIAGWQNVAQTAQQNMNLVLPQVQEAKRKFEESYAEYEALARQR